MEINSKPEELDALERKIRQIEIELVALKKEKAKKKLVTYKKNSPSSKKHVTLCLRNGSKKKNRWNKCRYTKKT